MKMKAITVRGPENISMDDVDIRELKDNEILIKVAYAGICATDLAIFTGESSFVKKGLITYPCRIGHEWSGVVEKTGKNVTKFKKGDRVITDNGVSCGECDACQKEDYASCNNKRSVGTINCWDGCFAEYMIMPEFHTYHMAPELSLKEAALAEPLSISLGALRKCTISNNTVAIIGTGAIGLGCAALADKMGAKNIVVIGRTPFKLERAKECGAHYVINARTEDVCKRIFEITDGIGVDVVIETSGGKETVMQSLDIVKRKGTVILAAFYEKAINDLLIDTLVGKEVTVKGVMGEMGLVPAACRELEKGLRVSGMITHCIDFNDVPEFFRHCRETSGDRIKAIVRITDM